MSEAQSQSGSFMDGRTRQYKVKKQEHKLLFFYFIGNCPLWINRTI